MKMKITLFALLIVCAITCFPSFIWAQNDQGPNSGQQGGNGQNGNQNGNNGQNGNQNGNNGQNGNLNRRRGPNAPVQTAAPFDAGLSLLIAAGIGIGAKKAYDKRKKARAATTKEKK